MMLKSRRPHFLNVFSSTSSAYHLKIPGEFIRNLEGRNFGSVLLKGPSGYSWVIELVQKNDDVFFDKGWVDFARDHSLECGEILVFRYDGDLIFDVKVFDRSTCEKEAAFHCRCSQDGTEFDRILGQKRDREYGGDSSEQDFRGLSKRSRDQSLELDLDVDVDLSDREHCGRELVLATKTCGGLTSSDENLVGTILRIHGKEEYLNLYDNGSVSMAAEVEEKKVAQSFNSCFPFFVRIMKRFNVSGSYTLNIPYQFSMEHLPNCKTEIVLRNLKGACWTVNSVPTTRVHTSHTLCGGWLSFVRSNEIKFGDICIFELVDKFELRVHILRVGKEEPDKQSGNPVPNELTSRADATFLKKSVKTSSKVPSKSLTKVQMCDSKMLDKRKYVNAATKSASVALCSLSRSSNEKQETAGLRIMLALDEEKAARSFASGFPNFVRIMKKFNISGSYTLKIPYKFSKAYLPSFKSEIVLRNWQGKCWTVNSVPDSRGRTVHTFCGGWMAFVRDNDIKLGDICIFELVNKCEMLVHISGAGRKGLDQQSAPL